MIGGNFPYRHNSQGACRVIGKWPGSNSPANGLYAGSQRTDGTGTTWRGWTLKRTGTGLYTVQWVGPSNISSSTPYFGETRGDVVSATNLYTVQILTEVASTGTITIEIALAGTATDPGSAELIRFFGDVVDAAHP